MEKTFLMVKPDGVQRGLVGEVVSRMEKRGLRIVAMKMMHLDRGTAEDHYAEHEGKEFYEPLLDYITSGPVIVIAIEGASAVSLVRDMVGETAPEDADPGTIRGDFGVDIGRNIVHAADSLDSAERELDIFFESSEFQAYERIEEKWVYE